MFLSHFEILKKMAEQMIWQKISSDGERKYKSLIYIEIIGIFKNI